MPKQNNNAGSGSAGPHKQGEKGGKGGSFKGGARSGGKKDASQSNPRSGARDEIGQIPRMGTKKKTESGKGSGNR
jgi:hypothetical protein